MRRSEGVLLDLPHIVARRVETTDDIVAAIVWFWARLTFKVLSYGPRAESAMSSWRTCISFEIELFRLERKPVEAMGRDEGRDERALGHKMSSS